MNYKLRFIKRNRFTHEPASKYACRVFAHALGYRVCNHISISSVSSHLRLAMRFAVQLSHNGSEFCIRNGGVFEERKHSSLVRLYIFPMPHVGTVTLLVNNTNHTNIS
jgi:hypothetical protein